MVFRNVRIDIAVQLVLTWLRIRGAAIVAACGLVVLAYWPVWGWMAERFSAVGTNYSHGWLIPFVSAWLVWRRRVELSKVPVSTSQWGLPIVAASLILHVLASRLTIHFVSGFSLIVTMWGLVLHFYGAARCRKIWFPLSFLVFMVPLPSVFLIYFSFKFKLYAASVSTWMMQQCGVSVVQAGSTIYLPNAVVIVDDTCSGMRSLITLLALGGVVAFWQPHLTWPRRAVLWISAVPIALCANILRVAAILFVTYVYGVEVGSGLYHDASGFVTFAGAFLVLLAMERALS